MTNAPSSNGKTADFESANRGSSPRGASGERVRVILDCDWADLQCALDMVVRAKPAFGRVPDRPGWGWNYTPDGKRTFFVRRTKQGYSATANPRDSDTRPQDGDAKQGSTREWRGPKASPNHSIRGTT